jgi:putative restriction endonuclease
MTTEQTLIQYIRLFSKLRTDRSAGWDARTQGQAPHKPILLLAMLDLFAQGRVMTNLIEITLELGELFASYWEKVATERRGNMALPFFHLRSSGFWHLLPQPGQETALDAVRQVDTLSQLGKLVVGAYLDEPLFQLLQNAERRNALRMVLIQRYFSAELQTDLLALGEINMKAFVYGQHLIEQARRQVKETPQEGDAYQPMVRDQGFRKAVVRIYDHRCALCGVRMLTSDGHTAVDAAHIIPWRISHDDDPHNGMALCGLCHWTFDQGLVGISARYQVLLSRELRIAQNVPGHLQTLEGRAIIGPAEPALWPDVEALGWHREKVFRQG